jgi:hypothetical protein
MKFVTNTVAVIVNNMFPTYNNDIGKTEDWSKVVMADAGTIFKVKAIMQNMVFLENKRYSINVDVTVFKEFFVEHEVEV